MKSRSERLNLYMDAGFPILYIATFEEDKADRAIREAAGNREIVEWNVRGLLFKQSKQKKSDIPLLEALGNFASPKQTGSEKFAEQYNLRRRVLVLKDAQQLLEVPEIVAQLKYLSERIVAGELEDANIAIIAPSPTLPKELEHSITNVQYAVQNIQQNSHTLMNTTQSCANEVTSSITSIEGYTFTACSGLTAISIPSGVTSIGNAAFDACSSLTTITIPSNVTSIGVRAFLKCSSLR